MSNDVFKALSDPTRRKILKRLKERDLTACEIADYFSISETNISQHLTILKTAQLISPAKKGQYVYYSLNTTIFQDMFRWLLQLKR